MLGFLIGEALRDLCRAGRVAISAILLITLSLAAGIYEVRWTFDPLEARNAHLNFNHLGAEVAETDAAATAMLGSGPFMFKEYQTGNQFTFVKNPDYFGKPFPYFDEVKAYIVTDTAKRVDLRGEIGSR